MKLPTPNKEIRQVGTKLVEAYGFTFEGVDSREHLKFRAPNGEPYTLPSTPKGTFSRQIALTRALKVADLAPERRSRDATRIKQTAAKSRSLPGPKPRSTADIQAPKHRIACAEESALPELRARLERANALRPGLRRYELSRLMEVCRRRRWHRATSLVICELTGDIAMRGNASRV